MVVVVVLPDPFRGMGAWTNSTEIQQSGHAPRSGPEIKNGSSAKDGAAERLECGTIRRRWVRSCKGCQQALHEEFSFRFILENRRNLAGEGVVRKISSQQRVASVSNLCNGWSRRLNVVVRSPPLYPRGGRDNFPEGLDHPVALNRLETILHQFEGWSKMLYSKPSILKYTVYSLPC